MTEAMIGGASMQEAMKPSGTKTAKEAKPKPAQTATPMRADHDMSDMSDMSGMDHK